MQKPHDVVNRLRDEISPEAFTQLIPIIEGDGIHLNHLRIYFMVCDYWQDIKETQSSGNSYENIAIRYDCSPITVRYHVNNSLIRLKAKAKPAR